MRDMHSNKPFVLIEVEVPKLIEQHIKPLTKEEFDLLKEVFYE